MTVALVYVYYCVRLYRTLSSLYLEQFFFYRKKFIWLNASIFVLNLMYIASIQMIFNAKGKIYATKESATIPTITEVYYSCEHYKSQSLLSGLNYLVTAVFQLYNLLTTVLLIIFRDSHLLLDEIEDLEDMVKVSYFMVYKDTQYQLLKDEMNDQEPVLPTGNM